jgi:hypothetical protein
MSVKMSEHGHTVLGAEIKITALPPFIEVEPITTVAYMDDDSDKISNHKHELVELPSLGISEQQLLIKRFTLHLHTMEGMSIGMSLDASSFFCTCNPPPIPPPNSDNTGKSSVFMVRTKLCSREELCSFLRNKLQKQINQQIKRNESKSNL